MNRWLAILAVVAVFFVGVLAGALGTHIFYSRTLREPGGPPFMASRFFADRLVHRLDLSESQVAEIDAILERSRLESEAIRLEMRPRVEGHLAQTWEDIAGVLSPEQRVLFEELRRKQRRRMDQFLLKPPGPRGSWRHGGPHGPRGERPRDRGPEPPPGPPPPPPSQD